MLNSYFNIRLKKNKKKPENFTIKFDFFTKIKRIIIKDTKIKNFYYDDNFSNNIFTFNRIFISFPKIKHTNNCVTFLIFIFNKYRLLLKKKINKINKYKYKYHFKRKINKNITKINKNYLQNNLKQHLIKLIYIKNKNFLIKRYYLSTIYLYKYKLNYLNLLNLYNIIYKLYCKKIKFNIINLKYVYLDNSILVNALTVKLHNRKNNLLKVLRKTLKLVSLFKLTDIIKPYDTKIVNNNNNNIVNKKTSTYVIKYLKNKHIVGLYLKASGRLTRRMTAARAVSKIRYKGNLINYYTETDYKLILNNYFNTNDNKFKGYDRYIRGNHNYNVVLNKNCSFNKNGSFGIMSKQNLF
jgi:hypothetical protein